jgi:cell division protein FtsI/penicillin-binding protein 2
MGFMGWYEAEANKPQLAFACMATHYPDGVYGGTLCAPIINKILQEWKSK